MKDTDTNMAARPLFRRFDDKGGGEEMHPLGAGASGVDVTVTLPRAEYLRLVRAGGKSRWWRTCAVRNGLHLFLDGYERGIW
jgi:hypothetical protein